MLNPEILINFKIAHSFFLSTPRVSCYLIVNIFISYPTPIPSWHYFSKTGNVSAILILRIKMQRYSCADESINVCLYALYCSTITARAEFNPDNMQRSL